MASPSNPFNPDTPHFAAGATWARGPGYDAAVATETPSGFWFSTLSAVRRADPAWAEIAHYLGPVRRHLDRFHGRIPESDRDDIAQDILVAMRERIVRGYDPARGRFRDYLKGAIEFKVRDWHRSRKRAAPGGASDDAERLPAPVSDGEAAALDLEAELLRAIRTFHDRHAAGADEDLDVVYAFGDRLVRGLPEADIARKEGWSRDRVKRLLARAREEILRELAGAILARSGATGADAGRAGDLVREAIRRPRERSRLLDAEGDPRVRDAADELCGAIEAARRHFVGIGTETGRELLRGLEELFATP